nr:MAG TPA: hypothetical protein [Caudoviricetes sp.]
MRVFLFFFLIGCHSFLFSLSYLFLSRSIIFILFLLLQISSFFPLPLSLLNRIWRSNPFSQTSVSFL